MAFQATEIDRLPPDQRAVLSLVLEKERTYAEVAAMLGMSERAVRERAHAALDTLAGLAGDDPRALDSSPPRVALPTGSRRNGAILLGVLLAAAIAAIAIAATSGGGGKGSPTHASGNAAQGTSGAGTGGKNSPRIDKTLTLTSADPSLKAAGVAYVLSEQNKRAFYGAAPGLPASSGFFYAVWLYNSPSSSTPLGRAPSVGSNGRMEGGGALPSNARLFHRLIVTRETSTRPSQPGEIVLSGTFALH